MKRFFLSFSVLAILIVLVIAVISCSKINSNNDPHFTDDGCFIRDSLYCDSFAPTPPQKIKFYVEVSGSMNGFFRSNIPTKFKEDVWRILNYYSPVTDGVTVLTNDGNAGSFLSIASFQTPMNTGAFVSSASTKVPVMLETIINEIDTTGGEVAVLISDMKYSPVGEAAPNVLLTHYSTDISKIFGDFGKAVSLVGATSDYFDKSGNSVCQSSPYYYLIMGAQEHVAFLRNGISSLLENNESLIGNIESGFDYGTPSYSFGISDNCFQIDGEPTFVEFDSDYSDTCLIKLRVDLAKYRWAMTREDVFSQAFQCSTTYGSEIKVDSVRYVVQNITNKNLERTAYAEIDIKLYNMPTESEVIRWNLELPDTDISEFAPYFGATEENDVTKSYSLENFIKGMFYGGVVNQSLKPNYILISKNS